MAHDELEDVAGKDTMPLEVQTRVARISLGLLIAITTVMVGMAIKSLYIVLVPFTFAFFFTVLVQPVQEGINDRLSPRFRWVGTLAAMGSFVAGLAAMVASIWWSIQLLSRRGPEYREKFSGYWDQAQTWLRERNVPLPEEFTNGPFDLPPFVYDYIGMAMRSFWSVMAFSVVVFFLMLLLLVEMREWKRKSLEAFQGPVTKNLAETIGAISEMLRRFFYVRAFISFISAVVEGIWIWVLGVEFAFVWALLFFVLNFVPNIGSVIAAIPPVLLAFVQYGPVWGLVLAVGLLVIEQFIANYIDPRIQGKVLSISPFVVLLSILFWAWAWGIAGAFIAVPVTITIMIVCSHVPALQPVAILMTRPGNDRIL